MRLTHLQSTFLVNYILDHQCGKYHFTVDLLLWGKEDEDSYFLPNLPLPGLI